MINVETQGALCPSWPKEVETNEYILPTQIFPTEDINKPGSSESVKHARID